MTNTNRAYTVIADTRKMTHEDWLTMRHGGLGGSDAAVATGLSRWKTPFQLWTEKTNRVQPSKAGESAYWGSVMEPILRREFAKRSGYAVKEIHAFFRSVQHPYMLANIDGCVDMGDGQYALLEIKTAGAYAVQDWADGLPVEYFLQIQHYLCVTGLKTAFVAVLLGGNKFEYQKIDRDTTVIENVVKLEAAFWDYVKRDVPPPVKAKDSDFLSSIYQRSTAKIVTLPPEAADWLKDYQEAAKAMDTAKTAKEEAEAKIKAALKDADTAMVGGYKVSWKSSTSNRLNGDKVKALLTEEQLKSCTTSTSSRRFTISQVKAKK
jgi:putative phage-type endonuclease